MSYVLPRLVPGHYRWKFRPGADQAHLAPSNIEKLREFVQAPPPQEPPDARMPGIILCLMRATAVGKRNRHLGTTSFRKHRPELENVEWAPMLPYPRLAEEHTRAQRDAYHNCEQCHTGSA
jgi:hypothetical protein